MRQWIESVERALADRNWHAALALALVLPDICGKLEQPNASSQARYAAWFDAYVRHRYTFTLGPDQVDRVFLGGDDCYALRCAYLHEGSDDVSGQKAAKALESFRFVAPRRGAVVHCNQFNETLQLQVDIFCGDICAGVVAWTAAVPAAQPDVAARLQNLLNVYSLEAGML